MTVQQVMWACQRAGGSANPDSPQKRKDPSVILLDLQMRDGYMLPLLPSYLKLAREFGPICSGKE